MAWMAAYPVVASLAISAASALLSYLLTPPPPDQEGPRLDDLAATTSAYGKFRPITYGQSSNAGNIIDASTVYEVVHKEDVGGKGGKSSTLTTYTYQQDIAVGLGEGVIDDIMQIFANEELIYDVNGTVVKPSWLEFKFYTGSEDQLPDPTLQAIHGIENTPAYLGEAFVMFYRFNLSNYGNRIPNFRIITITDANSESIETRVQCNNDFGTTPDELVNDTYAILTSAHIHPLTGYMVHGWQWNGGVEDGRANPIGTVTDPYSNKYLFSLNAPASFGELNGVSPSFGTLPKYEYLRQTNGDYEHVILTTPSFPVQDGYWFFIYSAYSDVLEAQGKMVKIFQMDPWASEGSVYANNFIFYGRYEYSPGLYNLVYWDVIHGGDIDYTTVTFGVSSGLTEDVATAIEDQLGVAGFIAFNMKVNTTKKDGDLLLGSQFNNEYNIIKYTHNESFKWITQVPPEFVVYTTGYVALARAVYDKITDSWWSCYGGKIWNFRNDTGETIGAVIDISADPNLENMYTLPTFSPDTRKLYWVSHDNAGDIPGSYNTATGEVENYPVGSYESAGGLNSAYNADYFHPTNSLFYSSSGSTRTNPSRKFRLKSLIGNTIPLSTIFDDICNRCGIPAINYNTSDVASVYVDGFTITNLTTGRSNAAPLQHGYLIDVVDSGGVLKFIQKGKPSVTSTPLTNNDIGATKDISNPEIPIKINRIMESQLPATADIIYVNPDSNYEPGAQQAQRGTSTNTNSIKLTLPIVFDNTTAKQLIDVVLHLAHIERENYELSLMPTWQFLEAGDTIDVETDYGVQQMQIITTSFTNGILEVKAVRVENSVLVSYLEGDEAPPKDNVVAFPGIMLFALLDIPLLRDTDDNSGFYAAATSYTNPWAGGVLFKSPDETAWNVGSTFASASIYGTTNDALPDPVSPWQWDNLNTIVVQVISGELFTVSEEQALQGFNSIAYGRDGRWEIINYVKADSDPEIENVYHLSKLIRGRLGTDHNINNHEATDIFIPLSTSNIQYVGNELADLGVTRYYRGTSFDVNIYNPSNITQQFVNTGVCITPLSPQQIGGARNSALDLTITWMPRSRYPASDFWSGVASETDDLYDIEIYLDGETAPVRTIIDNIGRSYVWLRSDQLTEADGTPQVVDISVWHKSQRLLSVGESGRGYEGQGRAIIGLEGAIPYYEAVDVLEPEFHFRTDEVNGTVSDGQNCPDSTGNLSADDALYMLVGSLYFGTSKVPSNNVDPLDTLLHVEENAFGDGIDVINNNICNTGDKFSLSFVINVRDVKSSQNFISRSGHFSVQILNPSGYIRFSVNGTAGTAFIQHNVDLKDPGNETNHFVIFAEKIDTDIELFIYKNGVLVSSGNVGTTITDILQPVSTTLKISPELMYLDDFAFHNDVLSASQIAYLFSQTGL